MFASPTQPFLRLLRYCAALCLLAVTLPAKADCSLEYWTAFPAVNTVFDEHDGYDFKNYDLVCNKLNKANARVVMMGGVGVLISRSYAWIVLAVADRDNPHIMNIASGHTHTRLSADASTPKTRELLWESINIALNEWAEKGLDNALAGLDEARRQLMHKPATQR